MMLGRIGEYELLEKIGEGGMGVVFKGRHIRLDRLVAVKVLPDELARDAEYRARFEREARAEALLTHPNIATCFDVGEAALEPPDLLAPGSPAPHPARALYLAMEYVPGTNLEALIGDRPLPIERVLDLTIQIAGGLEAAHRAGVIHRDLKPSNVRVTAEGQVKIVDFGLARIDRPPGETVTLTTSRGHVMGTPHYMAPEQTRGRTTDPRSDLFSLGVIAYQLVTGRLPFVGDTAYEVAGAVATLDPPPMTRYANVPDELERVVRKLIAKDPDERYQSAHEVRTDLRRLKDGRDTADHGESRAGSSRRRLRRSARAIAVGAAALMVVAGAWWGWQRWGPRPAPSIAVIPLRNLTGDPRYDYLCEGMASGVVGGLVNQARMSVASMSTVRRLDSTSTAQTVAKRLGVNAVLEGALRRQGGITFVDVELVDGRRNYVRWSESYPYVLQNAMDIQAEIVRQLVRRLTGRTLAAPPAGSGAKPRSLSAYDLYMRAGPFLNDPDEPHGPDQALELYARALDVDPDFALAWAGQSLALVKIYNRDKDAASLRRAEEAANRAIRLNPELLEARLARAQILRLLGRHADSIRELQDVLKFNPNWDEAWLQLAASYRNAGDLGQAKASARQAIALRPDYWKNWDVLGALMFRGSEYDSARVAFREVIRLAPGENQGWEQLASIELVEFNFAAAMALFDSLRAPVATGGLASNMGTAYFFTGRLADAGRYYVRAVALEPRNHACWRNLGDLHSREGKADSARADYAQAVRLLDEQIHLNPKNIALQLDRARCLAKAGDCASAQAALAAIAGTIPPEANYARWLAQTHAVCHQRKAALDALGRAVALGFPPQYLREEAEFAGLARDPEFLALTETKKR